MDKTVIEWNTGRLIIVWRRLRHRWWSLMKRWLSINLMLISWTWGSRRFKIAMSPEMSSKSNLFIKIHPLPLNILIVRVRIQLWHLVRNRLAVRSDKLNPKWIRDIITNPLQCPKIKESNQCSRRWWPITHKGIRLSCSDLAWRNTCRVGTSLIMNETFEDNFLEIRNMLIIWIFRRKDHRLVDM